MYVCSINCQLSGKVISTKPLQLELHKLNKFRISIQKWYSNNHIMHQKSIIKIMVYPWSILKERKEKNIPYYIYHEYYIQSYSILLQTVAIKLLSPQKSKYERFDFSGSKRIVAKGIMAHTATVTEHIWMQVSNAWTYLRKEHLGPTWFKG